MNPLLIRFGLPWLIFGSAVYALYCTILRGEGASAFTPMATSARYSPASPSAGHRVTGSTSDIYDPPPQTSSQTNFGNTMTTVAAPPNGTDAQILLVGGKLTLRIARSPLRAVLDEVSKQSGIVFVIADDVATVPVSNTIRDASVYEALGALLRDFDVWYFRAADGPHGSAQKIWVYAKGQGQIHPRVLAGADRAEKSTPKQSPRITANGIDLALQDADPNIRQRAMADSDAQGIAVPIHTLQRMAINDPDTATRILAMSKLAQDPQIELAQIRAVAQAGLRDGDPSISAHARDMLEQLDQAAYSNDQAPQLIPDDPPVE